MSDAESKPRRGGGALRALMFLLVVLVILVAVAGVTLRAIGLIRPFYMPTGEMVPAISIGDHVLMEGFTFRSRKPQRGDVVVFSTDKPGEALDPGTYIMRIAGLPGDTLRLDDGKLVVNDKVVNFTNVAGKIHYEALPEATYLNAKDETVTVPEGSYFMLGDNTNASKDSRFWGFLPINRVLGKVSFCYWPASRAKAVK
jgi:signal peptidase I